MNLNFNRTDMIYDLLATVEDGGCSAKHSPLQLGEILKDLPQTKHPNLLVDIETHDDAGVYKLTDDLAIIQTTDFFPPVCSDPFEFGQIAAANALSDIYAMGGKALTALNLVMFPSEKIPLDALHEILRGGMEKVREADAVIAGGHTIDDYPPKYGLAVTGVVHPEKIITNSNAKPGEMLILAKPVGSGVIAAGKKLNEVNDKDYQASLDNMKKLNKKAGEVMQKHGVRCATDITGFGVLGHALKMAIASNAALRFESRNIPLLKSSYKLVDAGCIPGAAFRNLKYIDEYSRFLPGVDYNLKMLMLDAQTSGGLMMTTDSSKTDKILQDLREAGYEHSSVIGRVESPKDQLLIIS